jgi:L-lactate dehydrogenase complex protein LldG
MIATSPSREAVLARIRGSHPPASPATASADYASIPRTYIRFGTLDAAQRLDMFEERLVEYDAHVHRVTEPALPKTISEIIHERGIKRTAIPVGLPKSWLPPEIEFTEADHLSNLDLNNFDGVLTACTVAIALTGTIVLQNAVGQGPRKLSLIPDYHLSVVFADQIAETVSEAFDRLAATAHLPTTFISGPSATADIEMTRIKGVHGPRFLDVLIVG